MTKIFTLTNNALLINLATILNLTFLTVTNGRIESVEAPVAQCDIFDFESVYAAAVETVKADLLKRGTISKREANTLKDVMFMFNCAVYNASADQDEESMQEYFDRHLQSSLIYLPAICNEANLKARAVSAKNISPRVMKKAVITLFAKLGYSNPYGRKYWTDGIVVEKLAS